MYDARYHIVRVDGWIVAEQDDPPTLTELQKIAQEIGRSVYLTDETADGRSSEIGYAGAHSRAHDYVTTN